MVLKLPNEREENSLTGNTYMGYVYGLRFMRVDWALKKNDFWLYDPRPDYSKPILIRGMFNKKPWYSPRQRAKCRYKKGGKWIYFPNAPHGAADAADPRLKGIPGGLHVNFHKCGVNMYTFAGFQQEYDRLHNFATSYVWSNVIAGQIYALTAGWGKTIVHQDGYRVANALVTHLYIGDLDPVRKSAVQKLEGWNKRGVTFIESFSAFQRIAKERIDANNLVQIHDSESRKGRG